jgi:hypothetical protein
MIIKKKKPMWNPEYAPKAKTTFFLKKFQGYWSN